MKADRSQQPWYCNGAQIHDETAELQTTILSITCNLSISLYDYIAAGNHSEYMRSYYFSLLFVNLLLCYHLPVHQPVSSARVTRRPDAEVRAAVCITACRRLTCDKPPRCGKKKVQPQWEALTIQQRIWRQDSAISYSSCNLLHLLRKQEGLAFAPPTAATLPFSTPCSTRYLSHCCLFEVSDVFLVTTCCNYSGTADRQLWLCHFIVGCQHAVYAQTIVTL